LTASSVKFKTIDYLDNDKNLVCFNFFRESNVFRPVKKLMIFFILKILFNDFFLNILKTVKGPIFLKLIFSSEKGNRNYMQQSDLIKIYHEMKF